MICFSHLRWDFVYQRPHHLMARFARVMRVYFIEEPLTDEGTQKPFLDVRDTPSGVTIVVPHLPVRLGADASKHAQRTLIDMLCLKQDVHDPILWYYTPMAGAFSEHLRGSAVIYDCMDELSAFKSAPPALREQERALLRRADLTFTGGYSLYEIKRKQHPRVHSFPSSVDITHFAAARDPMDEPPEQAAIAHPRLGFFGVIDERMDIDLLATVADLRPNWHFMMVGPIVKVDPAGLPRRPNIHFVGRRKYEELPAYLAGWDVAIMPFALTNRRASSARPRRQNTWLAANPSCRPRSRMSSVTKVSWKP